MAGSVSQFAFVVCFCTFTCNATPHYIGSAACRPCHEQIAAAYQATPMAQSSGTLTTDLPPGEVNHKPSHTRYRIEGRAVHFSSESRPLRYFIGSLAQGRSFLFESAGFLFLAPVTWYAERARWDMSPGFEQARLNLWNRPIEPNCLFCHSTRPQPIYGTQNRYADPPFAEAGIGCERCHGPGSDHAATRAPIVHPGKLAPAERDAICAQCHLTGLARIDRPGQQLAMYRPGLRLDTFVSVFVAANPQGLRVTSHGETLAYSACRKSAGEKLWCGSCHDAHRVPAPADRQAWFRVRCLQCHAAKLPPEHAARAACIDCHMPRSQASDGNHGVFTDHTIPKTRPAKPAQPTRDRTLIPFPGFASDNRMLGLAYAEAALESNDTTQRRSALQLLRAALPSNPSDWNLLTRLAYLEEPATALPLYERSLQIKPQQPAALTNAGALHARQGDLPKAIEYWRRALAMNPGLTEASRNLATALEASGDTAAAREVLRQATLFAPGVLP
ncbi:MAG: tetratricopeptide repeat protein [Bryobacterales bacterium]|nr:tetratricopeptide repeat protein [Bryobacterales bacterium]